MEEPLASLATDPLKFVALCWPDLKLYDKQREILLSVRDHIETFCHAANEMGKDFTAALVAIWFFASRQPSRVITSSSSETQLKSILWSEIRHRIETTKYPLPFRVTSLHVEKLKAPNGIETEPLDYLIGHVTNMVENFQGHHLANDKPRVLVIFDEASGIPDEFYDAADSWAHRKLIIGNPLSTTNFFYFKCRGGDEPDPAGESKLLRKVIHIGGENSPNVQVAMKMKDAGQPGPFPMLIPGVLSYADYVRREREWDVVKKSTRLYGRFYEGDKQLMFPMDWLDIAEERWRELDDSERRVGAVGLDVAAGGRDNTCWTMVDSQGVVEQVVLDLSNTMEIVGRTIQLINQHNISPQHVAMDAGGGGKQIGDRLWEQGYHVQIVGFGEWPHAEATGDDAKVARQAYKNRRAELYGTLRELIDPDREGGSFALPPGCHELRQELAILPLQYDSEGRLYLPPKDRTSARATGQRSLRELLGRSPDRADSLVLAAWALGQPWPSWQIQGPLICSGEDPAEERRPFTDAELLELPEFLRELVAEARASAAEKRRTFWDDGDCWDNAPTLFL